MILATQITLLVFAALFCLMTMSAKTVSTGTLLGCSAAGAFILLLVSFAIL